MKTNEAPKYLWITGRSRINEHGDKFTEYEVDDDVIFSNFGRLFISEDVVRDILGEYVTDDSKERTEIIYEHIGHSLNE